MILTPTLRIESVNRTDNGIRVGDLVRFKDDSGFKKDYSVDAIFTAEEICVAILDLPKWLSILGDDPVSHSPTITSCSVKLKELNLIFPLDSLEVCSSKVNVEENAKIWKELDELNKK